MVKLMARLNRLRKNSGQRPNREGHDVQSCHKSRNINVGFSRWGSLSTQQPLFPQTVQACCQEPIEHTGFSPCAVVGTPRRLKAASNLSPLAAPLKRCPDTDPFPNCTITRLM